MLGVGATMEKEQHEHEHEAEHHELTSDLQASTVRVVGFQIEEEED